MVDPQVDQFEKMGLLNLLAEVNRIIQSSDCRNIYLAGDLNCDFMRDCVFVNTVRQFVTDENVFSGLCIPYQDESLFLNVVWRAAGCPEVGELYEINRQAKMQYKYAVRRLKQAAYNIKKDKLLAGLLDVGLDIFQEIKKWKN